MLLTRYVARQVFVVTVFVTLTLTAVVWLTQSLKLLELVAGSDAPPSLFLTLVLLSLPKFLETIVPIAIAVASLFVYNKMIADNELVVMRACGVDQTGLARPALLIAGAGAAVLLVLSAYVSPKCLERLSFLRQTLAAQYSALLLREGVFNTFGSDLTVYLRERGQGGDLYGVLIHDRRERDKPPVTITARVGRIVAGGEAPLIMVEDGMRQQMTPEGQSPRAMTRLYFSRYTIEVKSLSGGGGPGWRGPDERTLLQLLTPDMSDPRDAEQAALFRAEAQARIASPFNALCFVLLALWIQLGGGFNRRGHTGRAALAALAVAAAQAAHIGLGSLMRQDPAFIPLFHASVLIPLALGWWGLKAGNTAGWRGVFPARRTA